MKVTIDTFTSKPFRWNGTTIIVTAQGKFVTPSRNTDSTSLLLHPSRVPPELLRSLNDGKEWKN